jgi:hypothetical protein
MPVNEHNQRGARLSMLAFLPLSGAAENYEQQT